MRDLRADLAASTRATTAHGRLMMAGSDLRDEIPRLEERIEDLAEAIARSRRLLQISKIAIAVAAIWILATIAGAIGFDPAAIISAMAAMIGGVVLFGSTTTTLKQTSAAMKEAEAQRAELIGKIELRVVGESRTEHH
jgi:Na+/H+-translocating membrane pyrophosphatase